MSHDIQFLAGMVTAFVLVAVLYLLLRKSQPPTDAEAWRRACGNEQQRADKWRALFERQRHIDDLSPAAQRQEQFDVDRQARVLGYGFPSGRRSEP